MILHTIISPVDILYSPEMVNKKPEKNNAVCVTDPYFFLEKDEYYRKYIQKRK